MKETRSCLIIVVPHERPVTYSCVEVPREVPLELKSYFPDGVATSSAVAVKFDGHTYHVSDWQGTSKRKNALDIDTGDVVILDFANVRRGE